MGVVVHLGGLELRLLDVLTVGNKLKHVRVELEETLEFMWKIFHLHLSAQFMSLHNGKFSN